MSDAFAEASVWRFILHWKPTFLFIEWVMIELSLNFGVSKEISNLFKYSSFIIPRAIKIKTRFGKVWLKCTLVLSRHNLWFDILSHLSYKLSNETTKKETLKKWFWNCNLCKKLDDTLFSKSWKKRSYCSTTEQWFRNNDRTIFCFLQNTIDSNDKS